jgi:hypothetical protein
VTGPPSRVRRVSRTGAGARCHVTDTGRAAQSLPTVMGMGLPPGELVRRHWGASPGRMMALSRRCQGIKRPRTGGRRMRAGRPRARRAPIEGGADPRARRSLLEGERTLERGGARSREEHPLERDGARPREACTLERGEACSRGSSSGPPWWVVEVPAAWAVPFMVRQTLFGFVAGFKWGFPGC